LRKKVVFAICAVAVAAVITVTVIFAGGNNISHTVFTGMGTVIDVKLYGSDNGNTEALSVIFTKIEGTSSARLEDSELTKLNLSGFTENAMLIEQAKICGSVYEKSNGAFDATVGKISSLWNIGFPEERVPSEEEILNALAFVGFDKTTVTDNSFKIGEGQRVDFGAITKGYACDKAKEYLDTTDIERAVISVGGSLLFYGTKKGGWTVAVKNPFDESTYACTFKLKEGFVSTSGSYERFFVNNGVAYHHIINPSTGYPAESTVKSVTVVAESGALSDALSTACFVLGYENSKALLEAFNASAIFILEDKTVKICGDISPENVSI